MAIKIPLNGSDWLFKGYYGEDWRWRNAQQPGSRDHIRGWKPATVPGSVQNDLWMLGEIPDPYFERNSLLSEWVCQRTWLYRKAFQVEPSLQGQSIQLVFKGVDYEADFFLNGELLGHHLGMYTPAVFEVGEHLKYGKDNLLVVAIAEAPHEQPQVGFSRRVRTHKARMNYWWDFSPRMIHQGIWDEIYLDASGPERITDVFVQTQLNPAFNRASFWVHTTVKSSTGGPVELHVEINQEDKIQVEKTLRQPIKAGTSILETRFDMEHPRLWWPNGFGEQPLYEARVSISEAGAGFSSISDQRQVTFGVREIRFVPNEDAPANAKPYTLQANGQRMYVKGWNWVPIDTLYGVERPQKLERLLGLAREANVNLLRVWGGGLIEKEAFYNLCDRLGILVWQEFIQSSSGVDNEPPTDPDFIQWMVQEARQIIPGRRNHPSLALWCGGNELYAPTRPLDDDHPMLAALKSVVQELDPGRCWLPTSASGPTINNSLESIEKDPSSLHDVHGPWEYQGLEKQYTLYNLGSSLYHSEFGVEGITNLRALNAVIAREHQDPVSLDNPYWFHAGSWWVWPQVWEGVFGDFKDIEEEVGLVQFLQFEGLRYAVEADRRRWPHNSGTSPWQFNEPFPNAACTSAVDYFAEAKPAYYAVAGAYCPLTVTARYPRLAWKGQPQFGAEIWAAHDGALPDLQPVLLYRLLTPDGREMLSHTFPVTVKANQSLRLAEVGFPIEDIPQDLFFLDLNLRDAAGASLAANRYLFTKGENLSALHTLPAAGIACQVERQENTWRITLENSGDQTAFYVWLEADHDLHQPGWAYFSSNYFCLLPGEQKAITVQWDGIPSPARRLSLQGWNTKRLEVDG